MLGPLEQIRYTCRADRFRFSIFDFVLAEVWSKKEKYEENLVVNQFMRNNETNRIYHHQTIFVHFPERNIPFPLV